mmetsp:Transcript_87025/g.244029  ORF Transcript_87025/g.244029 Transcript_87025/m.244029 type:complete len:215 (+) Transcript_87025:627-1271(+)
MTQCAAQHLRGPLDKPRGRRRVGNAGRLSQPRLCGTMLWAPPKRAHAFHGAFACNVGCGGAAAAAATTVATRPDATSASCWPTDCPRQAPAFTCHGDGLPQLALELTLELTLEFALNLVFELAYGFSLGLALVLGTALELALQLAFEFVCGPTFDFALEFGFESAPSNHAARASGPVSSLVLDDNRGLAFEVVDRRFCGRRPGLSIASLCQLRP